MDIGQLATFSIGFPLTEPLRERADLTLADDTAPEAPGA